MSDKEDILLRKKIADFLLKARKIVADHKAQYTGIYYNSGGGGTTSSNTTSSIPPEVLAEYQQVTGQANQIASNPLQQYQGPVVAGLTPEENSAFNTIDNSQGTTAPYTASANNLIGQATQGINPDAVTSADIAQYQSPYTQQVLNTTMAAENNQDAQQQAQLQGNAISAGAWGGDRAGVAQGILGGQQAYANNATNAGILNQGYSQALSEANTQQQQNVAAQEATGQLDLSGGLAENQLGTSALSNTLAGANAQLSAGQVQQQQAQSELNVPYEQFLQQQAYPYQTTGWLANIAEGLGSNEGGTTTGTTTQPSQGLFKRGGGIVPKRASGGIMAGTGPTVDNLPDWMNANPGYTYNSQYGTLVNSQGQGYSYNQDPYISSEFDAGGNYISPNAPVAAKPSAPAFTAQTAPAAATSAAPSTSGVSYTGGTVKGINPAGQADLDAIYGKKARGGIVAPKHFDAGGGDITPDDVVQASTGYTLPDGTSDSMPHDYSGTSMPPLPSQNISSDSESLPPPTPPVNAQGHPDAVSATSATVPNYEKDLPSDHQANPWLSVAAGVLGTLAGRSRNPLIDIGQGGLIGLNNYAQQSEVADKQNYQEGSFHQNAQKLAQEAQQHIDDAKVKQQTADATMKNANTNDLYRQNQMDIAQKELKMKQQIAEQGKIGSDAYGRYYTTGPDAGQPVEGFSLPGASGPNTIKNMGDTIGVPTIPLNVKNRADTQAAAKMMSDAYNNSTSIDSGISNMQRIKELLPKIDQGKMAQAERYGAQVLGEGTPERAAYDELQKLEANGALQNELSNGVIGKNLGFRMADIGQKMFANPEMSKDAQQAILNKTLFGMQAGKEANEIVPHFEGSSPGTLAQVKQKYLNDTYSKGAAIPANDYITGAWKKDGYKIPASQQGYSTTQSAPAFDYNSIAKGQQYTAPDGSVRIKQ